MGMTKWTMYACLVVIFGVCWTVTGFNEYASEIECYFCEGDARNSTCANNDTDFDLHPEVRVGMCRRGMCVKWARWKNGSYILERTCTYAMPNFHLIVSDDCRKEKFGNGYICMCGRDKCNSAVNNKYYLTTLVTLLSVSGFIKILGFS